MPRKAVTVNEELKMQANMPVGQNDKDQEEIKNLNRMLAAVLNYLSDDEVDEIDIEYLLNNTEGLKEWWDKYRERNKKQIEEEIVKSLGELSLKELETIRAKIKEKQNN